MGKINNNALDQIVFETDLDDDLKFQVNGATSLRVNANLALGLGNTTSYGTAGQVLTSNGAATAPYWQSLSFAPTNNATFTGNNTISNATLTGTTTISNATVTGNNTISNATLTGTTAISNATLTGNTNISETGIVRNTIEKTTVAATAMTGTVNVDLVGNTVQFFTANASANWTFNFRANSTVAANTFLSNGESTSVVLLVTNGGTAYYPNSHTIDGSAVTPKWQGGTAPTGGNASGVDAYTYTIVKTGNATYTVFASQTQFA